MTHRCLGCLLEVKEVCDRCGIWPLAVHGDKHKATLELLGSNLEGGKDLAGLAERGGRSPQDHLQGQCVQYVGPGFCAGDETGGLAFLIVVWGGHDQNGPKWLLNLPHSCVEQICFCKTQSFKNNLCETDWERTLNSIPESVLPHVPQWAIGMNHQ